MSQIAAGHIGDAILTLDIAWGENLTTEIARAAQLSSSFLKLCKDAQSDAARYERQVVQDDILGTFNGANPVPRRRCINPRPETQLGIWACCGGDCQVALQGKQTIY